jgi:antitoxin component of RelBE/YafQ-DinJ toxin-antitoxin module
MGTRSVRLDDEAESALAEIVGKTGVTISEAIKCGLIEYRNKARKISAKSPFEFFTHFDLGEGGYTKAPAREAGKSIKAKLKEKQKQR